MQRKAESECERPVFDTRDAEPEPFLHVACHAQMQAEESIQRPFAVPHVLVSLHAIQWITVID